MTLDEAIAHAEEVAKENQRVIDTGIVFNDVTIDMLYCDDTEVIEKHLANYQKRAEEYRQLAEWLRDYKQLKKQEPCEDAISRQAVLDLCDKKTRYDILYEYYEGKKCIRGWNEGKIINFTQLMQLPSVIPQSKTGHWIIMDIEDCELFMAKCSECGEIVDSRMISKSPYCHCGAKMVDLQENEEV